MPFDERTIVLKAIERIERNIVEIFSEIIDAYPDVARRGTQALFVPQVDAGADRKLRDAFRNAGSPDELAALLQSAIAARTEAEVIESLSERRHARTPEDGEVDEYGPRI